MTLKFWLGLVSLFNGISTFVGYLMPNLFYENSWVDKGVHTFPKGICPKGNIIARLEYELAYYDSAVHRFNHYTTILFCFFEQSCFDQSSDRLVSQ